MFRSPLLALLLLCCASLPGRAAAEGAGDQPASPRLYLKTYTQNEGLPAAQVFSSYQDRRGYLWFGTPGGLARYNGASFRIFSVDDGLAHDSVRSIVEHDGALWFTGEKGVTRYDGGRFTRYTAEDGLGDGIVWRAVVHDKRLWFGTSGGGLSRFDGRRFVTYTTKDGLPSDNVFALLSDGAQLWIGTRGGGLCRFDGKTFQRYGAAQGLPARQVMALAKLGGTLWVGTRDAGIFSLQGGRFVRRMEEKGVYSVGQRRKELFWGTLGQGVLRVGTDGATRRYRIANGLAGDRIYSILVDREDSVWFTTNTGVSKLLSDKFVAYFPERNVLSIARYRGAVWLGTLGQGLIRLDSAGHRSAVFSTEQGLPDRSVWSLGVHQGQLWIGTASGLVRYDGETLVKQELPGGPSFDGLYDLVSDGELLWLATTGGVCAFDGARCETFTAKQGLGSNIVYSGARYGRGVCFGTEGGISCVDRRNRARPVETFTVADGLPSNTVYAVEVTGAGDGRVLWAGTNKGLVRYDGERFTTYSRRDGLAHNLVSALAASDGQLLVGTNLGLNFWSRGRSTRLYQRRTGLISNEINFSAIFVDADASVWLGTSHGVTRYLPRLDRPNPLPPPVWIERVTINGMDVSFDRGRLVLDHRHRNVDFAFAGLSFKDEENVVYRFKLEGYDRDWSDPTSQRSVRYTNLSPGRYTFRVKASNADGVWSPAAAAVGLTLRPPYWMTWWFGALGLLAAAALVYGAFRLRLRKIRRRTVELERTVEERTLQLRRANEELKELSLTDPLTRLRNRRYLREVIDVELARVRRVRGDRLRDPAAGRADKGHVGFILLDLDHFKEVNDTHGHAAGDALLRWVGERLREGVRDVDAVIRWGGEEFLVVCKEVNARTTHELAGRLVAQLRQHPLRLESGEVLTRTCSAGFSLYPFVGSNIDLFNHEEVIGFADHALYVAKKSGRDMVVGIVGEEGAIAAGEHDELKRDVAAGVRAGKLRVLGPEGVELELE